MKYFLTLLLLSFSFQAKSQLATQALLFDGVNDLVTIPTNAAYQPGTADFTIEFWFRSNTVAGGAPASSLLFSTRSTVVNGIEIFISNGRPGLYINGGGMTAGVNSVPDLRDSVCHHIAVRKSAGAIILYLDGIQKLFYSQNASISSGGPICLGGRTAQTSFGYLKGVMKEVSFWNRALSQTEIINSFNKVHAASTPNLIGYWRLNATSGQSVADLSVTANSGVLGLTANSETTDPGFGSGCPSCAQPSAVVTSGGSLSICSGDSVLLSVSTGTGNTYQWYKNALAISGAVGATYYAKTEGAYSVVVTNASGCSTYSNAVGVTVPIEQFRNLTGSVPVRNGYSCLNNGSIFLYAVSSPTATYQWYKDNILVPGATSSSIQILASQPGAYSCQVNSGGCSLRTNTINARIFTLTATAQLSQFCQDTTAIIASANYVPALSGSWYNNSTFVNVGSACFTSQYGFYTYQLTDTFTCPVTLTSNVVHINAGTVPVLKMFPAPVVSSSNGLNTIDTCVNGNPFLYLMVTGHNEDVDTSVMWLKDGVVQPFMQNTMPIYENGIYSFSVNTNCGSTSIGPVVVRMIDYSNPPQISASATSGCPSVNLSVMQYWDAYQWNLNGQPIPGATSFMHSATQSGNYTCVMTNRCGSITTYAKSVNIIGPGAQISTSQPWSLCNGPKTLFAYPSGYTYKWLLNNTLIAGATSNQYVATVGGQYRVIVTNACKSDTSSIFNLPVATTAPLTPGTMTGPTRVCPGATGVVYSISSVATATSYQWVVPTGITITLYSGTSITVNVSSSYVSGDITVRAVNACGWSPYRTKTVRTMIPAMPGSITGPTYGVCNSTVTYSIAAVSQATTYSWVAPAGATILSGQGTTAVTVAFPSNYTPDTLRVSAGNSCAFGPVRKVVVRGQPIVPGAITGPSTACNGQTGVNFSITPVYGALSYTWNKPTGSTITSGQGTTSATITFGPTSGNVTVKSVNTCGASGNSIKAVTINCREADLKKWMVYPNPSPGNFLLSGDFMDNEIDIQLFDMTGKMKFSKTVSEPIYFGEDLVPGVYILKVTDEYGDKNFRLVKI